MQKEERIVEKSKKEKSLALLRRLKPSTRNNSAKENRTGIDISETRGSSHQHGLQFPSKITSSTTDHILSITSHPRSLPLPVRPTFREVVHHQTVFPICTLSRFDWLAVTFLSPDPIPFRQGSTGGALRSIEIASTCAWDATGYFIHSLHSIRYNNFESVFSAYHVTARRSQVHGPLCTYSASQTWNHQRSQWCNGTFYFFSAM